MKMVKTQEYLPSLGFQYLQHLWILFRGSTNFISLLSFLFLLNKSSSGYACCLQHLGRSSFFLYHLQPIAFPSIACMSLTIVLFNLQMVICQSLPLVFHHQGLVVTLMWQLITQCSKGYQVVSFVNSLSQKTCIHIISKKPLIYTI